MAKMKWHGDKIMRRVDKDATRLRKCLGHVVATNARRLVPVLTGALKGTIRDEEVGDSTVVRAGNDKVDYAGDVELGTERQAAQPYMRPAVEQLSQSDVSKCIK